MQKWILGWLGSLLIVSWASAATAMHFNHLANLQPSEVSDALPWSMGAKIIQRGQDDVIHATGAFIKLPVPGAFSPFKAVIVADEVTIRRVPNTRRDVDAELRGNVHMRYTLRHD